MKQDRRNKIKLKSKQDIEIKLKQDKNRRNKK